MRKFHEARVSSAPTVTVWGTGTRRREFLHVDDLASACLHLLETYDDPAPINGGVGDDVPIADLASLVADTVGFTGEIVYDTSRPTARRASCSTCHVCKHWAGSPPSGWPRGWHRPIGGSSTSSRALTAASRGAPLHLV